MSSSCTRYRAWLRDVLRTQGSARGESSLRGAGPALEPGIELGTHQLACEDCSELHRALMGPAALLPRLALRPVPRELDGRVVASLHAGYRQERAVLELQALERLSAPPHLAERLHRELAGGGRAASRLARAVGLGQVPGELMTPSYCAPPQLAEYIHDDLRREGLRRCLRGLGIFAATAAALVLWVASWDTAGPVRAPGRYSFTVRQIQRSELIRLEPSVRSLVSGWTGGLLEVSAR